MTSQERIARADSLYQLMTHVPGDQLAESPACADVADPEVFFPVSPQDAERIEAAKAVCAGCGLRAVCRERALRTAEPHGVWGGLTEWEREEILRERRAAGQGPRVSRAAAVEALDVVSGSIGAVTAGAHRAVDALERIAGHELPLVRHRVATRLSDCRRRGDGVEQTSAAVLAVLRPELHRLGGDEAAEGVAA